MNIIFLNELRSQGKINSNMINVRSDFAFCQYTNATHINFTDFISLENKYKKEIDNADFAIIVPAKTHPEFLEVAFRLRDLGIPFGVMQEGANNYWEEWTPDHQFVFLAIIQNLASVVLCHNEYDKAFFKGITNKPVIVIPTGHHVKKIKQLVIPDQEKKEIVFIGSTVARWYNGMVSYLVANQPQIKGIAFPTMGRIYENEKETLEKLDKRIVYYPYMSWLDFMNLLSNYKYAVHLMPEVAAGTFSLNCAMLGIPCIGNKNIDTQRACFPDLSIDINDTKKAKELLKRLTDDKAFYTMVREKALKNVDVFDIEKLKKIILPQLEKVAIKK